MMVNGEDSAHTHGGGHDDAHDDTRTPEGEKTHSEIQKISGPKDVVRLGSDLAMSKLIAEAENARTQSAPTSWYDYGQSMLQTTFSAAKYTAEKAISATNYTTEIGAKAIDYTISNVSSAANYTAEAAADTMEGVSNVKDQISEKGVSGVVDLISNTVESMKVDEAASKTARQLTNTAEKASEIIKGTMRRIDETYDVSGKAAATTDTALSYVAQLDARVGASQRVKDLANTASDVAKAAVDVTRMTAKNAVKATLRMALERTICNIVQTKRVPDFLSRRLADSLDIPPEQLEELNSMVENTLDQLQKGSVPQELDEILEKASMSFDIPKDTLRTWLLELSKSGEIPDEMWTLICESVQDP